MDQLKIGKFISKCRKDINLTQAQLAEKLNITDRAVSKWENGRSLPDASIMLDLCNILNISVNELLIGEKIDMNEKENVQEKTIINLVKEKQDADKRLLKVEVLIGILATCILFALILTASFVNMKDYLRAILIVSGFIIFIVLVSVAIRLEQVAGYYQCKKCGHKYVPSYKAMYNSPHMGRTRYMKCPCCNQKSWQKKVIEK